MPKESLPSFFGEGIKLISFCPLCQSKQNAMEVNILEETGESRLIHLRCQRCQAAVLALVTATPFGLSSVGMLTDLSVFDAQRFRGMDSLDFDEVIDLHLLLKNQFKFCQDLEVLTGSGGLV